MELPATAPRRPGGATAERFDELLAAYRARFQERLSGWLAAKRRELTAEVPEAAELVDAVAELAVAGGKRLRPALVHHTYLGCGGRAEAVVMPVALATELLHTYLLVHDDIMDHAEVRRGLPAAHVRFAAAHRAQGWRGDAVDFGRSAAILAGDLAHTWAVELFAEAGPAVPAAARAELDRCFAAMCGEVIGGQYLELRLALEQEASEDELLRVLRLKSGRYSVERPIQLGALLAAAPAATREALSRYGHALGEAFQLQDDVLGLFGDADAVGKPVGGDLEEGKYTFLIHHALAAADATNAADAARLRAALGRPGLGSAEIAAVVGIIRRSGALERVKEMIATRLTTARSALAGLDLEPAGADFLAGLVDGMEERRR
jgi:geranylgeranyl diphosphate synthase type I